MFFQSRSPTGGQLELRFGVASPKQWGASQPTSPAKLIRNLDDEFATPQLLLREALFQMHGINRTNLSASRRLKLCLRIHQRVWSTLAAARDALRKNDDGVPEPKPQQELLDLSDQLASALAAGYQIAIEADYRPDNRQGRAERGRILIAAVHTLELIHLQQRLRALRYQPLADSAWQVANTLFCVLARADQLTTPVEAMTDDRLLLDGAGSTSAMQLYAAIQAFGLFDTFSWAKRQQRFLDSYCAALPDALKISYAPTRITGRTIRFSHAYQNGPPSSTPPADNTHRILIDCTALADAVLADKESGKHRGAEAPGVTSACLSGLPPLARRPTMRAMLSSLEHERALVLPNEADAQHQDFRLETGLERVKQHLQALFTSDGAMKEEMLRNSAFSGRSSTMGDDAKDTGGTAWKVLRQSEHHVLVQTRETGYTKQIALGALAVFGIGEAGFALPRLGTITRIVRTEAESLYVEIKQIARFATMVNIVPALGGESAQGPDNGQIPCLLAYDDSLGWCIISSQQQSLPVGCPIQIRTRRLRVDTRLRTLREITPYFLVFQLDAQNPMLGVPSYPSPRKQRRNSRLIMTSHLRAVTEPTEVDSSANIRRPQAI
jgi:hypothetical protein